jgi:hypothetical protein
MAPERIEELTVTVDIELKPGQYRVVDLTEKLNIPRRTLERYIKRLDLSVSFVGNEAKPTKIVTLDEKGIKDLMALLAPPWQNVAQDMAPEIEAPPKTGGNVGSPQVAVDGSADLYQRLLEAEVERAELRGELRGIREVVDTQKQLIASQTQTIDTLKGALMLEAKRTDTPLIEYSPTNTQEKNSPGIWSKLKRIVAGS